MTKTELEKKMEEMQEQFAKMQDELNKLKQVKIEEPKKRWKPKLAEKYWYINQCGSIAWTCWYLDKADVWRYLIGNVFKTKQEAEEHKKKIKIQAQFKNFVEERTEELDWEDENESKYRLVFNYEINKIETDRNEIYKNQGTIYASSEQILRDAIKEIGEENVKKYILEVEE